MRYIKTYESNDMLSIFVSGLEKFVVEIAKTINSESIEEISSEVKNNKSRFNINIGVKNPKEELMPFMSIEIWDKVYQITLLLESRYIGMGYYMTSLDITSFFEDVLEPYWDPEWGCYIIPKDSFLNIMKNFTKEEYMLRKETKKYNL